MLFFVGIGFFIKFIFVAVVHDLYCTQFIYLSYLIFAHVSYIVTVFNEVPFTLVSAYPEMLSFILSIISMFVGTLKTEPYPLWSFLYKLVSVFKSVTQYTVPHVISLCYNLNHLLVMGILQVQSITSLRTYLCMVVRLCQVCSLLSVI